MLVKTTRFGEIEVDEKSIINMPNGLLGFSNARLYTLLDDEIGSPFKWLQSLEKNHESLAFVTIDPQLVVSDYKIGVTDEQLKRLHAKSLSDLKVMVIVTMTKDIKDVTINLQGPLVINYHKRLGMQLVITDSNYSTRHPLFGDKLTYQPAEQEAVVSERKVVNG